MKITVNMLFWFFLLGINTTINAQEDKSMRPSPPAMVKGIIDESNVVINYSSPAVKGREIWGGLVPNGKIWRTGANEATIFETDKELMIQGQKLPPGKYALFTIPGETEWTFVFNSEWNQWGAFKYDKAKDVMRVKGFPSKTPVFNERLRFEIDGNAVNLYWENKKVGFEAGS